NRIPKNLIEIIMREAKHARAGRFEFLGARWPVPEQFPPPAVFWHVATDEQDDKRADSKYCFDALVEAKRSGRDLKRIWELSRLQFLMVMALAAQLDNDVGLRAECFSLLEEWMRANQPYRGLAYASGIELAVRVISVAILVLVVGIESLTASQEKLILAFLHGHEEWIARFPSLYSSANNHRVAELSGLLICHCMRGASKIERQSVIDALAKILQQQIVPDGVGAEQAPNYTAFSIEIALVAFAFAEVRADNLPEDLTKRLFRFLEFSVWSMDRHGFSPDIGDNDAGRAIMLYQKQEPRYLASVCAMLSAWLGAPRLAPPDHEPHIRDLLFKSSPSKNRPPMGMKNWCEGGYSIWRGENASYQLIFDHGPLGHLSIAAHGHADTLAVWLTIDDTPVLVDAGTLSYIGASPDRNLFRETIMHNTLNIDQRSSSQIAGPFNWSKKALPKIECLDAAARKVEASHNGYYASHGVSVYRSVQVVDNSDIVFLDGLSRGQSDKVYIPFLFGPAIFVDYESDSWILRRKDDSRALATLKSDGPLIGSIINDRSAHPHGRIALNYGVAVNTACLLFQGRLKTGDVQKTTIKIAP
ncbi:MAG: alginate lyase family protein, partial [Beijerinckiaceae bacterium]